MLNWFKENREVIYIWIGFISVGSFLAGFMFNLGQVFFWNVLPIGIG